MGVVTISRGTFSGGRSVAECIAQNLGWRSLDGEVLMQAAGMYGIPYGELSESLTRGPGIMERLKGKRKRHLACIRAALCRQARDGNVVYHGRAGHLLLQGVPDVLKVRLIADMELRTDALRRDKQMSKAQAVRRIRKMDEEREKWTRACYHVDREDPALYDVTINLDHMTSSTACQTLASMANKKPAGTKAPDPKALEDLVLGTHLTAIIANDRRISGDVEVEANSGVVTINGTVESLIDADRVKMRLRDTPEVKEINSRMRVRLAGVAASANSWN